jgi:hypothetical protein
MRVPARPDMDSDLIICDALEAARTALAAAERVYRAIERQEAHSSTGRSPESFEALYRQLESELAAAIKAGESVQRDFNEYRRIHPSRAVEKLGEFRDSALPEEGKPT